MAGQSKLERLLPEVQLQILLRSESFGTLHALILASPRMYHVFRLNKRVTLSTVARRHFDSATTRAALAIEKLYRIEHPPFSRDNVLRFFNFTLDELDDSPDSVLPLPVSIGLGKLDGTVNFFIEDYAQNTLPILMQLKSSPSLSIKPGYKQDCRAPELELSRCESKRLRRAFYRFETYRQLFSQCSSEFNHKIRQCSHAAPSLTAYEQAEMFFQSTPAYKAAQVACIRDYLHRRLRGVFDQVEDGITQKLQAECPKPKDKYQGLDWDWANERRYQFLADDEHYFGYSGKYKQGSHIEYLLSLGLPYIRRILESAGDERQDLLLCTESRCDAQYQTEFITAALGLDPLSSNDEQYGWNDRKVDSCMDENSRLDLPPGWLWAHTGDYYHGLVDVTAKGLRDWGYVFWDKERLQKAGILDLDPRHVRRIEFNDYLANRRPSVQERWIGPDPSLLGSEDEVQEEQEEQDEGEGGQSGEQGGQDEEHTQDKGVSHHPSTTLSLIGKWIWDTGKSILRRVGIAKRTGSIFFPWLHEGFRAVLDRLHVY